jgi:hypothetical protein
METRMNLGFSENGDGPTIDVVIPAHIYIYIFIYLCIYLFIIHTYGNFNRDDDDYYYYCYYY